jgi:hypothetical protein
VSHPMHALLPGLMGPQYPLLYEAIVGLGLTSNLKLCLDAADSASYSSGQSWLDRSGGGYDFFRGADGSATATDPTFNGTPGGKSSSEYWSFDGGDYFNYDTANEAWMENLHKDGAKFTIAAWCYFATTAGHSMIGNSNNSQALVGFNFAAIPSTGLLVVNVSNGSGTYALNWGGASLGVTTGVWQFCAATYDEATGAGYKVVNQTHSVNIATPYTTPSASGAASNTNIARNGSGQTFGNGSRMAGIMAWEGVAFSPTQVDALFRATRRRFNV